jgi:negative regulator of sigma E activity
LAVFALGSVAHADPAHPPITDILRSFVRAQRSVNMRGTLSVLYPAPGGGMTTVVKQVSRRSDGRSRETMIEPQTARGISVIENNDTTCSYDPRDKSCRIKRIPPPLRTAAERERVVRLLARNYKVTYEASDWIAGRRCHRLLLNPRSGLGHPVKMWIDAENGAELSREESEPNGNTLSVWFFKQVQFPKSIATNEVALNMPLQKPVTTEGLSPIYRNMDEVRKTARFGARLPLFMPGGYEFDHAAIIVVAGAPNVCIRYTDGLMSITIIEARNNRAPRPGGTVSMSSLPFGERMYDQTDREMKFLIFGHIRPDAMQLIGGALSSPNEPRLLGDIALRHRLPMGTLQQIRDQGLAVDAIAALAFIAARSGANIVSLAGQVRAGRSWQEIAGAQRVPLPIIHAELTTVMRRRS